MIYLLRYAVGAVLFLLSVPFMLLTLAAGETYLSLSAASDWCFGCACEKP